MNIPIHSPWLAQLDRTRPISKLTRDGQTDVIIVGGGIAGVMTSYFLLRDTNRAVTLIEADKIGHGATGHNAGQVTSYFERPFSELVEEFGLPLAAAEQASIESAWMLLETVIQEARLQTPLWQVTGYAGLNSEALIVEHLRNNALKVEAGLTPETMYIAHEFDRSRLPAGTEGLYELIPQTDLLDLLETEDKRYIAALAGRKGCINSAMLCEELIGYLLQTHPGRFVLAEHSPVHTVRLTETAVLAETKDHVVTADNIVLCTNGFEHFSIIASNNTNLDTSFHSMIHGTIGYMMGYLDPINKPPSVVSYLDSGVADSGDRTEPDLYYYLTRRPFEHASGVPHNLISIGGPDSRLPDTALYSRDLPHPDEINAQIERFVRQTYRPAPQQIEPAFRWHGLMGYTPNSVRRIGPEPREPRLLYNLGCNGVGILGSIFGGHRIARYIDGQAVEPSIFDIPTDRHGLQ